MLSPQVVQTPHGAPVGFSSDAQQAQSEIVRLDDEQMDFFPTALQAALLEVNAQESDKASQPTPPPKPERRGRLAYRAAEATPEENEYIHTVLAFNGGLDLKKGSMRRRKRQDAQAPQDSCQLTEDEDDPREMLKLLYDGRVGVKRRCVILDWMIGGLLAWHQNQLTMSSFAMSCAICDIDPRPLGATILDKCVRRGILPKYARAHLAAWRWLEWLPTPKDEGAVKRERLRWLLAPLLPEAEAMKYPLLPEAKRTQALRQFRAICDEEGVDMEVTRRLIRYHCHRWNIVPFDAHERLAVAD